MMELSNKETVVKTLGNILIELFSCYVGTDSEQLLEEQIFVNNIIAESDYHDSLDYDNLSEEIWEKAWNIFNDANGY